jgi:hypothetical protein
MKKNTGLVILFLIGCTFTIIYYISNGKNNFMLQLSIILTSLIYFLLEFKNIYGFFQRGVIFKMDSTSILALIGLFLFFTGNEFIFSEYIGYYIGKIFLSILFVVTSIFKVKKLTPKASGDNKEMEKQL